MNEIFVLTINNTNLYFSSYDKLKRNLIKICDQQNISYTQLDFKIEIKFMDMEG